MNAIFSFIMDHVFSWLKILFGFLVFDLIFRIFVSSEWLGQFQEVGIYMMQNSVFKMVPEVGVVFMLNIFNFLMSVAVLFKILGHKHQPNLGKPHNDQK